MLLLDHFHPPLSIRRHWHAFHNAWATYIAAALNEQLPPEYFAEPNVQFGVEIDVAAFEESPGRPGSHVSPDRGMDGTTQVVDGAWSPPSPVLTVPFPLATDTVEVLVYSREAGPTLAGAIELVSPANKDRAAHRDAFVSKCVTYLYQAVGLIVADVVTDRMVNLHDELMERVVAPGASRWQVSLYATAYRPTEHQREFVLDIWREALAVGGSLPTMPLWLQAGPCVPVDFAATYERTCREHRITAAGGALPGP